MMRIRKWCNRLLMSLCVVLVCTGCGSLPKNVTQDRIGSTEEVVLKDISKDDVDLQDTTVQSPIDSNSHLDENRDIPAVQIPVSTENKSDDPESANSTSYSSAQELIDAALEYCQASNNFWELGELDNAIDALDKAYSLVLQINEGDAELLQEKEDLRITISKRIIEVYSSRFTVANGSHKAIPLDMNKYVENALEVFKGKERDFFLEAYARSGRYRPAIVRALNEAGLPEELSWLPLIESGFKVRALSKARALGMWQFIASTGYKYGLKRDTYIDERLDPEKSTDAAIAYMTELHKIFGDWITVLAAYNCGEMRVLKLINSQKINYLDNFWDLYEKLPNETASYVPRFLAVLHIINNPEKYGFTLPPLEKEIEYENVTIEKQVQVKTIAERLGMDTNELRDLNPELRQDVTPRTEYSLRVLKGKGEILLAELNDIPVYRPPVATYIEHMVRSGETLSVIADKYKTTVKAIMDMNSLKNKNYLKVGWRLKIPTGRNYVSSEASSPTSIDPTGIPTEYVVREGDSLWKIANRYNTNVNAIRALNNLENSNLRIGQVLIISSRATTSNAGNTQEYIVKEGDSPYLIAKKNQMNLYEFLDLNNLTPQSTIFPGQRVQVVTK